mmetsp:Transcript_85843/g.262667  ORF Transcript_85843/g.262667 Transcript_85843/m.262667 type:complete len:296 (-) Transcript_85843:749-1636(-)
MGRAKVSQAPIVGLHGPLAAALAGSESRRVHQVDVGFPDIDHDVPVLDPSARGRGDAVREPNGAPLGAWFGQVRDVARPAVPNAWRDPGHGVHGLRGPRQPAHAEVDEPYGYDEYEKRRRFGGGDEESARDSGDCQHQEVAPRECRGGQRRPGRQHGGRLGGSGQRRRRLRQRSVGGLQAPILAARPADRADGRGRQRQRVPGPAAHEGPQEALFPELGRLHGVRHRVQTQDARHAQRVRFAPREGAGVLRRLGRVRRPEGDPGGQGAKRERRHHPPCLGDRARGGHERRLLSFL